MGYIFAFLLGVAVMAFVLCAIDIDETDEYPDDDEDGGNDGWRWW